MLVDDQLPAIETGLGQAVAAADTAQVVVGHALPLVDTLEEHTVDDLEPAVAEVLENPCVAEFEALAVADTPAGSVGEGSVAGHLEVEHNDLAVLLGSSGVAADTATLGSNTEQRSELGLQQSVDAAYLGVEGQIGHFALVAGIAVLVEDTAQDCLDSDLDQPRFALVADMPTVAWTDQRDEHTDPAAACDSGQAVDN